MKIVRDEAEACPLQARFATARREMAEALIERDAEIDLVLTGLVARENVLLVGPPGCAKSLLLDSLMGWMRAASSPSCSTSSRPRRSCSARSASLA